MTNRCKTSLVTWNQAQDSLRRLRHTVFVVEQKVPKELEWDGLDESAAHALAQAEDGRALGTGRLLDNGHIGRMAVLAEYRGRGIGSEILGCLLRGATDRGLNKVFLNAQVSALGFYERHGFIVEGEEFLDAGIVHKRMSKKLVSDGQDQVEPSGAELLARVTADGRRGIEIFLNRLDARLVDGPDFVAAAQQLLLRHPSNHLRICVQQVDGARAACPRLFGLLAHLPSRIELRQAGELQRERQENFALIDRCRYLRRVSPAQHEWLQGDDKSESDRLAALFDEIWLSAEIHPELRTLAL